GSRRCGESMECGGKRSATPLWLSPGPRCGRTIVRSVADVPVLGGVPAGRRTVPHGNPAVLTV
ncbi:MAG: hypothetical protein NTW21_36680, partial [Verrucomicrobia bacterium]|nr:hypothetical protein [Verrucomicrobiota bacterium]